LLYLLLKPKYRAILRNRRIIIRKIIKMYNMDIYKLYQINLSKDKLNVMIKGNSDDWIELFLWG